MTSFGCMEAAKLVICLSDYSTIRENLSLKKNATVVPRTTTVEYSGIAGQTMWELRSPKLPHTHRLSLTAAVRLSSTLQQGVNARFADYLSLVLESFCN